MYIQNAIKERQAVNQLLDMPTEEDDQYQKDPIHSINTTHKEHKVAKSVSQQIKNTTATQTISQTFRRKQSLVSNLNCSFSRTARVQDKILSLDSKTNKANLSRYEFISNYFSKPYKQFKNQIQINNFLIQSKRRIQQDVFNQFEQEKVSKNYEIKIVEKPMIQLTEQKENMKVFSNQNNNSIFKLKLNPQVIQKIQLLDKKNNNNSLFNNGSKRSNSQIHQKKDSFDQFLFEKINNSKQNQNNIFRSITLRRTKP